MRVLYLVHGHEQFSVGGAENAAFSLFREAQNHLQIEAWIMAAVHTSKGVLVHGELRSVEGTDREYLIGTSCEWFRFTNAHIPSLKRGMQRLLDHIQPEIIHLQHYVHFGIDVIPLLQSLCPDAKIVVTLHEYLALCMHNGQMVTTGQLKLCEKATPIACGMCYPEHNTPEFFLRHHYIKTILESCDALISPSEFLIQRYRDCGIDHPFFYMLENGLSANLLDKSISDYQHSYSPTLNRFAFFGQLSLYKGPLILFKAAYLLKLKGITNFTVRIHGANLEQQPKEFQDEFDELHEKVKDLVMLKGSYKQADIEALMLEADWTIIPSIWWENSPVVIQEAFFYRRPVLGSDIGGTAEKISCRGGITFATRSESSLAALMERCISNLALHQGLLSQMEEPYTASLAVKDHFAIYQSLMMSQYR